MLESQQRLESIQQQCKVLQTGQGHGAHRGFGAGGGRAENKQGIPVTKLSHLVKDIKIKFLEIYLFSLSIK